MDSGAEASDHPASKATNPDEETSSAPPSEVKDDEDAEEVTSDSDEEAPKNGKYVSRFLYIKKTFLQYGIPSGLMPKFSKSLEAILNGESAGNSGGAIQQFTKIGLAISFIQ